jgi:hypothetical protein
LSNFRVIEHVWFPLIPQVSGRVDLSIKSPETGVLYFFQKSYVSIIASAWVGVNGQHLLPYSVHYGEGREQVPFSLILTKERRLAFIHLQHLVDLSEPHL